MEPEDWTPPKVEFREATSNRRRNTTDTPTASVWISVTLVAIAAQCIYPPWVLTEFRTRKSANSSYTETLPLKHPHEVQRPRDYHWVWYEFEFFLPHGDVSKFGIDWSRLAAQLLATICVGGAAIATGWSSSRKYRKLG